MVFSDPVFLFLFLPLSVAIFLFARWLGSGYAQWTLVLSSFVFYSAWDIRWLPLLVGSIVVNYLIGASLRGSPNRVVLGIGTVANLIPLFIAKYAGWLSGGHVFSDIALPLGISFFTFQQIAFLVDCHQGKVGETSTRHYTLFVSFFPQLIAGPICHHHEMIEQFKKPIVWHWERTFQGLFLVLAGLFKKVVVADNLAPYADAAFLNGGVQSAYEAWIGSLAYTFQLYFDFAGYCEIAMGVALLFGYRIPINFLSPYKSLSVTEFWRRWHITLGRWFRDYVYIPLGGNRNGPVVLCVALFATAFASGIWHGAGLTFVLWGVMHGTALVVERLGSGRIFLPSWSKLVMTFLFVHLAWVMFRAPDVETAFGVYESMFGLNGIGIPLLVSQVANIEATVSLTGLEVFPAVCLIWWVWKQPNVHEVEHNASWWTVPAMGAAWISVLLSITAPSAFLYFQF